MQDELTVRVQTKGAEDAAAKVDSVTKRLQDTGKTGTDISEKLKTAGLAVAAFGGALTAASKLASDATVQHVQSVRALARVTGESVEDTSRMRYALERSGVAADQAGTVFGILSKRIQDANEKSGDAALKQADLRNKIDAAKIKIQELTSEQGKAGANTESLNNQIDALKISIQQYEKQLTDTVNPLQKIGVETKTADGRSREFNDILMDIADRFKAMPDGAEKTAAAMELFGRSGKNMIPFLNKGSDAIKDLMDQADKLGLTVGQKNVDQVAKYVEAQKKLKDAQQEVTLAIGNDALPMWTKFSEAQVWLVEKFRELPEPIRQTAAGFVALGGPALTGVGSVVAFGSQLTEVSGKSLPDFIKGLKGGSDAGGGFLGKFGSIATKAGIWGLAIGGVVIVLALLQEKFGILNPVIESAQRAWESMGNTWNTVILPVLKILWDWFSTYILPTLIQVATIVGGILLDAWNSLVNAFQSMMQVLQPFLPILSVISAILLGVVVGSLLAVIGVVVAAIAIFAGLIWIFAKVVEAGWALTAGIGSAFTQVGNWVVSKIGWIGGWIGDRFNEGKNSAINAVVGIANWIRGFNLADSGWALIMGFWNGINSAFNSVKGWVSGKLGDLRKLFPFSPAKEGPFSGTGYTTYSGRALMTGFGTGIVQGASRAIGSAKSALSRVAGLFGGSNDEQGIDINTGSGGGRGGNPLAGGGSSNVTYGGDSKSVTNQFSGTIILQTKEAADRFFERLDEDASMAELGVAT